MNLTTLQENKELMFGQLWHAYEKLTPTAPTPYANFSAADRITLSIFAAGMLSQSDLITSRLFFDAVPSENQNNGLQLFLIMMAASLNQGNGMFPAHETDMLNAYNQTIDRAVQILSANDQPYIAVGEIARILPELVRQFIVDVHAGAYSAIIGESAKPILLYQGFWYYQKYHAATTALNNLLKIRLAGSRQTIDEFQIATALKKTIGQSKLHSTQKLAVALACIQNTFIITGGPGTGKTTVVTHILRTLLSLNPDIDSINDILICAPTGRAAARLKESIAGTIALMHEISPQERNLQNISGQTVHRMLGYSPATGQFSRSHLDTIEARIVVIDEVSMLDITTFRSVLDALDPHTILLLLGDKNQLPSIEAGAVLGDIAAEFTAQDPENPDSPIPCIHEQTAAMVSRLLESPVDPGLISAHSHSLLDKLVVLTQSFRSEHSIARCAHLVNIQKGASAEFADRYHYQATAEIFGRPANTLDTQNFLFSQSIVHINTTDLHPTVEKWMEVFWGYLYVNLVQQTSDLMHKALQSTSEEQGYSARIEAALKENALSVALKSLFEYLTKSIILCVVRNGASGSETLNAFLGSKVQQKLEPYEHVEFFNGCPALVTKNMYALGLWNGDRGIILKIEGRLFFAVERAPQENRSLHTLQFIPVDDITGLEISFAMTVHKSQGGEFDKVLLILPELIHHPLLTKEIVYTALTRAKSGVAIVGSSEVFDAAISRKTVRRSGIIL